MDSLMAVLVVVLIGLAIAAGVIFLFIALERRDRRRRQSAFLHRLDHIGDRLKDPRVRDEALAFYRRIGDVSGKMQRREGDQR